MQKKRVAGFSDLPEHRFFKAISRPRLRLQSLYFTSRSPQRSFVFRKSGNPAAAPAGILPTGTGGRSDPTRRFRIRCVPARDRTGVPELPAEARTRRPDIPHRFSSFHSAPSLRTPHSQGIDIHRKVTADPAASVFSSVMPPSLHLFSSHTISLLIPFPFFSASQNRPLYRIAANGGCNCRRNSACRGRQKRHRQNAENGGNIHQTGLLCGYLHIRVCAADLRDTACHDGRRNRQPVLPAGFPERRRRPILSGPSWDSHVSFCPGKKCGRHPPHPSPASPAAAIISSPEMRAGIKFSTSSALRRTFRTIHISHSVPDHGIHRIHRFVEPGARGPPSAM